MAVLQELANLASLSVQDFLAKNESKFFAASRRFL